MLGSRQQGRSVLRNGKDKFILEQVTKAQRTQDGGG
jgi:hypothetical protein